MSAPAHAKSSQPKGKANRLLNESSTYLQQHAYNPVDWYPWSAEALQKARSEDKPILLSIGYAACHWCHVMAHESFEDEETAKLMNEFFVNIKVDREERTDLDEIYMKAVQMMTGHGGWPMTVFLTPELKPFFGGTYFPPTGRHGLPAFQTLLMGLSNAWKNQRDEITESSNELTDHIRALDKIASPGIGADLINVDTIGEAVAKLLETFDKTWGGFGGAPKFPHSMSLSLVMRYLQATPSSFMYNECHAIVETSLDRMAQGGIHDQIGGGFARYSVDQKWLIPHFEKMLYDNALLARTYLEGYQMLGKDYWKKVAEDIFRFVKDELGTANGAFYSSLDADSEGEEGKFYVWTEKELKDALTADEFSFVSKNFGVSARGNFENNTNNLSLPNGPAKSAQSMHLSEEEFWQKYEPIRLKLLAIRNQRIRPGLDEKVLTSWNSLMITAFVSGYKVVGKQEYLDTALKAAEFILQNMYKNKQLLRTWGNGQAKLAGCLDDYTYFIEALLELASVDADPKWLTTAIELCETLVAQFLDEKGGGFYFTPNDYEELLTRTRSYHDGAIPSGTSTAAFVLEKLARLTGREKYSETAKYLLTLYAASAKRFPDQFSNLLCAMDFYLSHSAEIVVVLNEQTKTDRKESGEWVVAVNKGFMPNKVVLFDSATENASTALTKALISQFNITSPLLNGRTLKDHHTTAFVCQNFACKHPVETLTELQKQMAEINDTSL